MTERLSALERAVLDLLLSREEDGYEALREQLTTAEVIARRMTGAGFFTDLGVSQDAPRAPSSVGNPLGHGKAHEQDVFADIEGMEYGAGFVLWLEDGQISTLEGFSYADAWPEEVTAFDVRWEKVKPGGGFLIPLKRPIRRCSSSVRVHNDRNQEREHRTGSASLLNRSLPVRGSKQQQSDAAQDPDAPLMHPGPSPDPPPPRFP